MFNDYVSKFSNNLIENTQKIIQINSVGDNYFSDSKKPFGEGPDKALNFMLTLGKSLGFKTKNIDGYCGYIEFGDGDKLLGIVGHLDTVPEGENWTYPPFSGIIQNGNIYGRGAIDDKGPVMASLYAMKIVMEYCKDNSINLNKRVRLILGLNEEKEWKCINYYKSHEEIPSYGFSPDADFPCIYAEKGIFSINLSSDYTEEFTKNIVIKNIDCNNNAINVVPKICNITLEISKSIDIELFIKNTQNLIKDLDFEIDIYKENTNTIKLTSYGKQAHSAHPELGINAVSRLIILINKLFDIYDINIPLFKFFAKYINTEINGESLYINIHDESGNLTFNVANLYLKNNKINIDINMRVPIQTKFDYIENKIKKLLEEFEGINIKILGTKDPLYIPKDNPLVKKLCEIYNKNTKSDAKPIAIGGATYARAFPNCISFGPNLPNHKDMCHQTNEFISIDNLLLCAKIYAEAILLS